MEDKTCKTCVDNEDGFCDRKGILVEDDGRSPRSNQYPCLLLQIVLNLLWNNRVAGWLTAILYRVKPMK